MIVTGSNNEEVEWFKKQMRGEFEMTDLGLLKYYLGLEVTQNDDEITVKQEAYVTKFLKEAGMWEANPNSFPMDPGAVLTKDERGEKVDVTKYRRLVGCLRYVTHTRPDLSYAVGIVSRYMADPRQSHMKGVKQVMRYLRGTLSHGIQYSRRGSMELIGYSDSSHATEKDDGRSTTGMLFCIGDSPVASSSHKQRTVALSSCEAEFMAATEAACEAIWLKGLFEMMTGVKLKAVTLKVDNKSALELMKNPVFHGRSKHINTRYHFIRECVEQGLINVQFIPGSEQKADVLTKPFQRQKFVELSKLIGIQQV